MCIRDREDNWTPPQPCKELVTEINAIGGSANIEVYPNSFHSFDGPQPLRLIPDAYSWANCKLKLNSKTKKVYDPNNESLDFSNKVADLAESEDHHPKIVLEYGSVEVSWWSHKIKGLHKNDFICAAKTDLI